MSKSRVRCCRVTDLPLNPNAMNNEQFFTTRSLSTLKSTFKSRRNSLRTRQLAMLEFTAKFYNTRNRAIGETLYSCVYEPIFDDDDGRMISPGCAIGQHAPNLHNREGTIRDNWPLYKTLIPDWMQDFGCEFLSDIQQLHDYPRNWNGGGLSPDGFREYHRLLDLYN